MLARYRGTSLLRKRPSHKDHYGALKGYLHYGALKGYLETAPPPEDHHRAQGMGLL
jgi:hypothetical protein